MRTSLPFRLIVLSIAGVTLLTLAGCGASVSGASATPQPPATQTTIPTTPPTQEPTGTPLPTSTATPIPGISLKDAPDLVELRTIDASTSWISGLSFSPTEHRVATFGLTHSVDIWDADSGKRVYHMPGQADWGLGLAYSPDGSRLVSGGSGSDIILWDATTGKRIAGLQAAPTRVYDIAWSPDGDRFAVVGQESSRMTIFGASGNKIQEIKAPGGWLWAASWSKSYLAASDDAQKKVYIYSSQGFGNIAELDTELPAGELDFSPDEKLLVGCLRDGTMHVWDTATWSEVGSWEAHPLKGEAQGCVSGAFSKDGSVYFSGGDDGNLIAWDIKTGNRLKTFEYGVMVWTISVSGDGELVGAGLDNGQVKILGLK